MEGEKIRSNSRSYGSTQTKVSTDRVVYIVHAVLPNETVAGLSVKYDVPIHNIRRANRLMMNDTLYQDMKLYIPTKLNPATLTEADLNGEPLVVGDNHAPVKTFRAEGAGAPVVASHMNNSLNNGSESSETLPVVAGDAAAIKKQPSVHEIFEKIDQTVQAVRGSISTFQKDGFCASHGSLTSEELYGSQRLGTQGEDTSSLRSVDSRSSKNAGIRKVDSYGHRLSGLSSTALQLANEHDNTDFPL